MRRLIIAALLAAGPAMAQTDMLFDNGHVAIRLTPSPCASPALSQILADTVPPPAFAASVTFNGAVIVACWAFAPGDQIVIVDAQGDGGAVPMGAFRPAP